MAKNNFSYNVVSTNKMPFKSKFNFDSEDIKKAISADAEYAKQSEKEAEILAQIDALKKQLDEIKQHK